VIDRALSKRRDDRQPSVGALAAALEAYAGALPSRSGGPPRPRTDRYVEVGGERIPVTWEDTGGETPGSGAAEVIHVRPPGLQAMVEASAHGASSSRARAREAQSATGRPPVVEDEDTTKVLQGELSTDDATPPRRRPVAPAPPPPPREVARGRGKVVPSDRPPAVPVEDVETTIVDMDPPSFATDLYVAARDVDEKDER
jgi:hypothetical protein